MKDYYKLHIYLTEIGFQPKTYWLENETRESFKTFIGKPDRLSIVTTWYAQHKFVIEGYKYM